MCHLEVSVLGHTHVLVNRGEIRNLVLLLVIIIKCSGLGELSGKVGKGMADILIV